MISVALWSTPHFVFSVCLCAVVCRLSFVVSVCIVWLSPFRSFRFVFDVMCVVLYLSASCSVVSLCLLFVVVLWEFWLCVLCVPRVSVLCVALFVIDSAYVCVCVCCLPLFSRVLFYVISCVLMFFWLCIVVVFSIVFSHGVLLSLFARCCSSSVLLFCVFVCVVSPTFVLLCSCVLFILVSLYLCSVFIFFGCSIFLCFLYFSAPHFSCCFSSFLRETPPQTPTWMWG